MNGMELCNLQSNKLLVNDMASNMLESAALSWQVCHRGLAGSASLVAHHWGTNLRDRGSKLHCQSSAAAHERKERVQHLLISLQ